MLWQMGDDSDISSLLAMHKPRIVLDEDGGETLLSLSFSRSCLIIPSGEDHSRVERGGPLAQDFHNGFTAKRVS